jgi:penicillin-binding protein 1C
MKRVKERLKLLISDISIFRQMATNTVRRLPRLIVILSVCIVIILGLFIILDHLYPVNTEISYSQEILAQDSSLLYVFLDKNDKWRLKASPDEITDDLKKTIIFKEDKYFYYHFGVNPVAVIRAVVKNMTRKEQVSGASSITMQVARLLEPKPRTYRNKIIEMFRALQLEWHLTKNEILQLYLNMIPYGGNVEGVKAAALLCFQQKPQNLSLAQVVTLSIIPNGPRGLILGKDNPEIEKMRNKWLEYFHRRGLFTETATLDAMKEPLNAFRHAPPRLIPHLAIRLHSENPGQDQIFTYIDRSIQSRIENLTIEYIKQVRHLGITNAAVIVVENASRQVKAYLGSADFYNRQDQGQVDGIRAARSPGSTLKPFLYALAIDKGMITPKYVITDVPENFNGYIPENYDQDYRGYITVEDALTQSLNIPAVKLLNEISLEFFIKKLSSADFKTIQRHKEKLGLSVILGGCGVTLEELVGLFSTFANDGLFSDLQYYRGHNKYTEDTLLGSSAAYLVTEMLTRVKRPDMPAGFENRLDLPRIAWKTGTSYGRRDAWSIGYNKNYTVGVWIGNFKGYGVPELNGTQFAAPLLFSVFNILNEKSAKDWFIPPENLDYRLVCARSGAVPNDFCTDLLMDYYIPGISSNKKCLHLVQVCTDDHNNFSFCRLCLPEEGYIRHLYLNHPPEIISFFEMKHIPYDLIPPHNPLCQHVFAGHTPVISSLSNGSEYILIAGKNQKLLLSCQVENDVSEVYWYINDKFFDSSPPSGKLFFQPESGKVKISCNDDKGRNTDIWITVKFV